MSLKPQLPRPIPPEIAAWGAQHLSDASAYKLIGDTLYTEYHDEEFADLYHREGKPALSPVLLAFVTVFQCLENLSDRAAANAVRVRLDWKYARHLPLADAGFDSSVLCEFRQRLIAHNAEGRVFEQVLGQMQTLGLLKQRGAQRSDSLALLMQARHLGRIELVFEPVRVALRALLRADADWTRAILPAEWVERYRRHCRAERMNDAERAALALVVGDDGAWLLERLQQDDTPANLGDLPAIGILRTVWEQQFIQVDNRWQLKQAGGRYNGEARIQTPYDAEARYSEKRNHGWEGYKLQVSETTDAEMPHLITAIEVTRSVTDDRTALAEIATRQKARGVAPETRYVDAGFMSGPTLATADARDEDLIGPIREASSPQSRMEAGLTHKDFQIDIEQRTAICPAGHHGTAKIFVGKQDRGDKGITFTFQKTHCRACPLKERCITGKGEQRFLVVREHYERVQQARERQHTEAFNCDYHKHRPGIEGCLSALIRGQGIRRCRYAGQAKNQVRALFIGAAVNLQRAARWRAGIRHRPRRQGLQLAATAA